HPDAAPVNTTLPAPKLMGSDVPPPPTWLPLLRTAVLPLNELAVEKPPAVKFTDPPFALMVNTPLVVSAIAPPVTVTTPGKLFAPLVALIEPVFSVITPAVETG